MSLQLQRTVKSISERKLAMRKSMGAFALIRSREKNGETRWLAQWNEHWQAYNFVGGHTLPNESFRECIIREITEELNIAAGSDFIVADEPVAHVEYSAWSTRAGQPTAYTIDLFDIRLERLAEEKVAQNPANRWLQESEIRALVCSDGRPISKTMSDLLSQAKLWNDQLECNS